MSLILLIFKNPYRNKIRSFLAITGIAVGIATIVALGALTNGLSSSFEDTMHSGGADFSILSKQQQENMNDNPFGTSTLSEDWINKIKEINGVQDVKGIYITMISIENNFLTIGSIDPSDSNSGTKSIINGRNVENNSDNEIIVGKLASKTLNKTVNDEINIKNDKFRIVGIFESGNSQKDNSIYALYNTLQKITDDKGKLSILEVYLKKGENVKEVTEAIENRYGDNITPITSISDVKRLDDAMNILNSATWAISLLAIFIGGIGIINTMMMAVFERIRELGVLKAVGWSKRKILTMILGESIVITVSSAILGSIIGITIVELLSTTGLGGLKPVFTPMIFIQGFAVAIIVGLIGGLYPALKASRLSPTEALRYE